MQLVTKSVARESSVRAMPSRICPRCGSDDVRQSVRHSVVDRMMAVVRLAPYRCRACRNRFFRFGAQNGKRARSIAEAAPQSNAVTPITAVPVVGPQLSPRPQADHPLAQIPIAHSLLIVSRDPAIRKLLCKLLTKPGCHTHQLADFAQLPAELRDRKVDLLITDLDLPEQQGMETLAALRDQYPNLKIIALSSLRMAGVPGSIVLPKPFHRELLLECVQNALIDSADTRQPASGMHA